MMLRPTFRRVAAAVLVGGLTVVSTTACSGGEDPVTQNEDLDDDGDGEVTPEEVMAGAKAKLDETSGVEVSLSTGDQPADGDFLASAEGVLIADPASFEGEVGGRVMGSEQSGIPVISVDGDVYVEVPVLGWQTFQPDEFCAPDPAQLLNPETGVSAILTATEDLDEGESELGGDDNSETITPFSGTVPADAVRNILPCAEGDSFDATYRIDGDGFLREAEITGEFFPGMDAITYVIAIDEYDVEQEITAPE